MSAEHRNAGCPICAGREALERCRVSVKDGGGEALPIPDDDMLCRHCRRPYRDHEPRPPGPPDPPLIAGHLGATEADVARRRAKCFREDFGGEDEGWGLTAEQGRPEPSEHVEREAPSTGGVQGLGGEGEALARSLSAAIEHYERPEMQKVTPPYVNRIVTRARLLVDAVLPSPKDEGSLSGRSVLGEGE